MARRMGYTGLRTGPAPALLPVARRADTLGQELMDDTRR